MPDLSSGHSKDSAAYGRKCEGQYNNITGSSRTQNMYMLNSRPINKKITKNKMNKVRIIPHKKLLQLAEVRVLRVFS